MRNSPILLSLPPLSFPLWALRSFLHSWPLSRARIRVTELSKPFWVNSKHWMSISRPKYGHTYTISLLMKATYLKEFEELSKNEKQLDEDWKINAEDSVDKRFQVKKKQLFESFNAKLTTTRVQEKKCRSSFASFHCYYGQIKQYIVDYEDTVAQQAIQHKNGERGMHFWRAGPRQKVYFKSDDVRACIVTYGGLFPGLNTVIMEIVCSLDYMYGVKEIMGIQRGYKGFYSRDTISLTPKSVNNIHKRGGTILGTSRGGHVTSKIVDSIQDRGINQVYIIGGDGTQKGAVADSHRSAFATTVNLC